MVILNERLEVNDLYVVDSTKDCCKERCQVSGKTGVIGYLTRVRQVSNVV